MKRPVITAMLIACGALQMHSLAFGTQILSIQSSDPGGYIKTLLNDGTIVTEVDQYAPCPPPPTYEPSPGSIGGGPPPPACFPPAVSRKLVVLSASASSTTQGVRLAYEFLDKNYFINNLGQIVAWPQSNLTITDFVKLTTQGAAAQTFVTSNFHDPSPAGCGINDRAYGWVALSNGGQLVGQVFKASCAGSFVLWNGDQLKIMGALPAGYGAPTFAGVNATGQLAITATKGTRTTGTSANTRALFWNGSSYSTLPLPFLSLLYGYTSSEAVSINDQGDVVGNLIKSDGARHAVIWRAGKATDLGTLSGFKSSKAAGLNSKSQVLACAYDAADSVGDPVDGPTDPSTGLVTPPKSFAWINGVRTSISLNALGLSASPGLNPDWAPEGWCNGWFHGGSPAGHVSANQSGQWLMYDYMGIGFSVLTPVR